MDWYIHCHSMGESLGHELYIVTIEDNGFSHYYNSVWPVFHKHIKPLHSSRPLLDFEQLSHFTNEPDSCIDFYDHAFTR